MVQLWLRVTVLGALAACGRIGFEGAAGADVPADAPVDLSLVVWFTMDPELATSYADASGRGDDATCSGTSCPIVVPGARGLAIELDGVDDRIAVPDSPRLRLTEAFTVSVWFKWYGGDAAILSKPQAQGIGASYELSVLPDRILICTDDTLGPSGEACMARLGPAPLNTWTALALTWDGVDRTGYVDGIEILRGPHGVAYDAQPLIIGGDDHDSAPSSNFRGLIDEVRIYDRALSPHEIAALHTP